MADETKTLEPKPPAKAKSKLPLIIAGAVVAVGLMTGGWFLHRGKSAEAQSDEQSQPAKTEVKSVMHLESFVVNLQGSSESGYLRVGVDLGLGTELKEGEKQTPMIGRLRDSILTVLGTRTGDELVTPEGKTKLKADLLQLINERVPEIQCKEVYFTEFLVQR